jgi:hypothetical protein
MGKEDLIAEASGLKKPFEDIRPFIMHNFLARFYRSS